MLTLHKLRTAPDMDPLSPVDQDLVVAPHFRTRSMQSTCLDLWNQANPSLAWDNDDDLKN